jgi:hypothetical protein
MISGHFQYPVFGWICCSQIKYPAGYPTIFSIQYLAGYPAARSSIWLDIRPFSVSSIWLDIRQPNQVSGWISDLFGIQYLAGYPATRFDIKPYIRYQKYAVLSGQISGASLIIYYSCLLQVYEYYLKEIQEIYQFNFKIKKN